MHFHCKILQEFEDVKSAAELRKSVQVFQDQVRHNGCRFQQREATTLRKLQGEIGNSLFQTLGLRRNCFLSKMRSQRLTRRASSSNKAVLSSVLFKRWIGFPRKGLRSSTFPIRVPKRWLFSSRKFRFTASTKFLHNSSIPGNKPWLWVRSSRIWRFSSKMSISGIIWTHVGTRWYRRFLRDA